MGKKPEQRVHKQYALEQSPLFMIGSKKRLAKLLRVEKTFLEKIVRELRLGITKLHFSVRSEIIVEKIRLIEEPIGPLRFIHNRLQELLSRIETPGYVFSGKKGVSHIDNAAYHLGNSFFLTLDIVKYFASARCEYIFRFFESKMRMPEDVAWFLTDLVCYQGHIPIGSPLSQSIAFFAFQPLFDRINHQAAKEGRKFSIFVDDMTISGKTEFQRDLAIEINYYLRRVELGISHKKTRVYRSGDFKYVTGVAVTPDNKMKVANKLRRRILADLNVLNRWRDADSSAFKIPIQRIKAAQQIEADFFRPTLKSLVKGKATRL